MTDFLTLAVLATIDGISAFDGATRALKAVFSLTRASSGVSVGLTRATGDVSAVESTVIDGLVVGTLLASATGTASRSMFEYALYCRSSKSTSNVRP